MFRRLHLTIINKLLLGHSRTALYAKHCNAVSGLCPPGSLKVEGPQVCNVLLLLAIPKRLDLAWRAYVLFFFLLALSALSHKPTVTVVLAAAVAAEPCAMPAHFLHALTQGALDTCACTSLPRESHIAALISGTSWWLCHSGGHGRTSFRLRGAVQLDDVPKLLGRIPVLLGPLAGAPLPRRARPAAPRA